MKNSSGTIENRTRDLPACNAVQFSQEAIVVSPWNRQRVGFGSVALSIQE